MLLSKDKCNHIDVARIIGIYLVILGHFPYTESNIFCRDFIYTFHIPLFFVISGLLYKQNSINIKTIKKILISLIVPYIIYNIIYLVFFIVITKNYQDIVGCIINLFTFRVIYNVPTWFFITLFAVKFIALFCRKSMHYILVSFIFLFLGLFLSNIAIPNSLSTVFVAFPFFTLGYLLKNKINNFSNKSIEIIVIFLFLVSAVLSVYYYGRIDMYQGSSKNIFLYFIVGSLGSVSILFISKYLPLRYFVKVISRGTMLIVGLHWLITIVISHLFPDMHFVISVILAIVATLLFYIPTKLTYDKIPILYGKLK